MITRAGIFAFLSLFLVYVFSTAPAHAKIYEIKLKQAGKDYSGYSMLCKETPDSSCVGSIPLRLDNGESTYLDIAVLFSPGGLNFYFKIGDEYLSTRSSMKNFYIALGHGGIYNTTVELYRPHPLAHEDSAPGTHQFAVQRISKSKLTQLEVTIHPLPRKNDERTD